MKTAVVRAMVIALLVAMTAPAMAAQDVLYLKNGSVIRGTVMELVPDKSVKIKTADGSIFVYKMDEVEKLTRDETVTPVTPATPLAVTYEQPQKLITLDPLGLIQFGPMVGIETRTSPTSYLTAHVRWATAGVVYYAITSNGFEDALGIDNLAVGLGYRALMGGAGPHHWYARPVVEYGWGSTSGGSGSWAWRGRHSYVSFIGNFGHRWRFAKSVTNVGVYAGVAAGLSNNWWYLDSEGEVISDDTETFAIVMLEVSFGWDF